MAWQSVSLDAPAQAYLRARLLALLAFDPGDARHAVRVAEVAALAATASVSIRKGGAARVPMFDLSFALRWEGRSVLGAARASGGELRVADVMPEDVAAGDDALDVRVSQRDAVAGLEIDVESLRVARTQLAPAVRAVLRDFAALLQRLAAAEGSDAPVLLAAEAARCADTAARGRDAAEAALHELATQALSRKTAADAAAKATAPKQPKPKLQQPALAPAPAPAPAPSNVVAAPAPTSVPAPVPTSLAAPVAPTPLTAAAAEAEALATLEAAAAASTVEHRVSLEGKAEPAGAAPSLQASVWNTAAWGWEEKEFTPWARRRLNELLAGVDVDLPGGHVRIVEVESVQGDVTVNLRKGRRMVLFDLAIVAKWEGTLLDDDGRLLGSGDGELHVRGLDQDSGPAGDYTVAARACSDGSNIDRRLAELVARWGALVVKKRLATFVAELLEKGREPMAASEREVEEAERARQIEARRIAAEEREGTAAH